MKRLAPDVLDLRFQQLAEMGRARLPALAPDWTDHNAHDPGITLMELLAWVTEAQLYSLGRMRRDERAAFGALLGLAPDGTQPARGLIWSDRLDPHAAIVAYAQSRVIAADAVVNMLSTETPTFRPEGKLLWAPGRIRRLSSRLSDGREIDHTVINERGGPAFQPFGPVVGKDDVLVMEFDCRGDTGLFPSKREDAIDAHWAIGVRADKPLTGDSSAPDTAFSSATATSHRSSLAATLVAAGNRFPLKITSDSSEGMLRTGALLLDVSAVTHSPQSFTIELRSHRGFERPPRLLRIEPNVVPIVQGRAIPDEEHVATGIPDWSFQLDVPGLRFASSKAPVKIELRDPNTSHRAKWRHGRVADSGPDDPVYEFDVATQRVIFGNGVNGRIPPQGAKILASYAVSDGVDGVVAANRKWRVTGFVGSFGINPDPMSGGTAPTNSIDERRRARRRVRDDHALVSESDIVAAALRLSALEVERAWVPRPKGNARPMNVVTLVAMRARLEETSGAVPETRRWLDAVHRRLVTMMPLTTRLVVSAPRYIEFTIQATIEAAAGRNPSAIKTAVERALRERLTLTGPAARQPGIPVTRRDLTAWIRIVDGVRRVVEIRIEQASGVESDEVKVPRHALPRGDLARSTIEVRRAGSGAAS